MRKCGPSKYVMSSRVLICPTPKLGEQRLYVNYVGLTLLKLKLIILPVIITSAAGVMAATWFLTPPPIHFALSPSKKHHQFHHSLFFKNQHFSSSSSSLSNTRISCNYNTNNNDTSSNTNKKPDRNALQLYTEIERFVFPIPPLCLSFHYATFTGFINNMFLFFCRKNHFEFW